MQRFIVGIGEVLWDMLPGGKKLGGAPANFAYHAGQFGIRSVVISALGNDALAVETVDALKSKGLNYVMPTVNHPTGTVQVSLDRNGTPTYSIKQGAAWDYLPFTSEIERIAQNCRAVCFGTLAQRSETTRSTINRFLNTTPSNCLKIFDINLRQNFYSKEIIEESLNLCTILKVNDDELKELKSIIGIKENSLEKQCLRLIKDYNIKVLILTCGTQGSYVITPKTLSFLNTPKVMVADTVGAGDAFTGAFCAAVLKGKSISQAHQLAVDISAYVCTQQGAMPVIPRLMTNI